MQYYLAKIGTTLGYNVWIAKNDHKREWKGYKLGNFSIPHLNLETISSAVSETISFIDVLWLNGENKVIGAFEVEKSTSIYSGILRLQDLSMSFNNDKSRFYLIAPNKRKKKLKHNY